MVSCIIVILLLVVSFPPSGQRAEAFTSLQASSGSYHQHTTQSTHQKRTLFPTHLESGLLDEHDNDTISSRRGAAKAIIVGGTSFIATMIIKNDLANSLDMDAFINSQLEADTKSCDPKKDPKCIPKLTSDEALCKYGQSGTARGEACMRVKEAGGTLDKPGSQGRSLGGAYAM